jgi:LCP family protein required for cell wall assembly
MSQIRRGVLPLIAILAVACSSSTPSTSPPASGASATDGASSGPSGGTPRPDRSLKPGKSPKPGRSAAPSGVPATLEPTLEPTQPPVETAPPASPVALPSDLVGSDGRVTILLLGSDAREGVIGERTDTIMVVTIDPATGEVATVSLPRDTEEFPYAPGRTYGPKINGLYETYRSGGADRERAFKKVTEAMAYGFDIEIDHWAVITFTGFKNLIDRIGGIDVTLAEPFIDTSAHVGKNGLHLKAGEVHLDGTHALALARSRHTTNDYDRSRRQQMIVAATASKVREMGADAILPLAQTVLDHVTTDIPISDALPLLALAQQTNLSHRKSIVLGPSKFAGAGPELYSIVMRTAVVRDFFDHIMGGG